LHATSQVDQRIAMADKYYDAGDYFTAAGLYEQFLNPPKKEIPKANFPLNTRRYGQGGGGSINTMLFISKLKVTGWQIIGRKQQKSIKNVLKKIFRNTQMLFTGMQCASVVLESMQQLKNI
jgi:hypothetical protein